MATKKPVMVLYSDECDIQSHRVRLVLAEKDISVEIQYIDPNEIDQELLDLNPYYTLPTLSDRDLTLYGANIIAEYIDERFPHPPLLPVYPVSRAKFRLMIYRIEQDWTYYLNIIEGKAKKPEKERARKSLCENIISISPVFGEMPYFLNEDFSILDCYIAPLLLRLSKYNIVLPDKAKAVKKYMKKIYERSSFVSSLSSFEKDLYKKQNDI